MPSKTRQPLLWKSPATSPSTMHAEDSPVKRCWLLRQSGGHRRRKGYQDEVLAARARLERVKVALGTLSPRTRAVFLMHRIDGMKYREIAAQLGITMSAVEKHVARAVVTLSEFDEDA